MDLLCAMEPLRPVLSASAAQRKALHSALQVGVIWWTGPCSRQGHAVVGHSEVTYNEGSARCMHVCMAHYITYLIKEATIDTRGC